MRTSDADLLIIPGWTNSGPDHWQSRWERNLSTARRVVQDDFDTPDREAWVERLVEKVAEANRPVVLIAHSCGVATVVHAAPRIAGVAGAFLVAPADVEAPATPEPCRVFAPLPTAPLPFPSMLIASRTDPYCTDERAFGFAQDWGSAYVDAGDAGHINTESGHGPWPDGLLRLAGFLKRL